MSRFDELAAARPGPTLPEMPEVPWYGMPPIWYSVEQALWWDRHAYDLPEEYINTRARALEQRDVWLDSAHHIVEARRG